MKGLTLEESVTDGVKDERGRKGTRVPKRALGSGGGAGSLRFGPRAGGSRGAPNHRPPRTACGAGPTPLYGGSLRGPSPPPLALVRRRPPSFSTFGIFPEPLRRGRAELLRRNARLGRQGEEGHGSAFALRSALVRGERPGAPVGAPRAGCLEPCPPVLASPAWLCVPRRHRTVPYFRVSIVHLFSSFTPVVVERGWVGDCGWTGEGSGLRVARWSPGRLERGECSKD